MPHVLLFHTGHQCRSDGRTTGSVESRRAEELQTT